MKKIFKYSNIQTIRESKIRKFLENRKLKSGISMQRKLGFTLIELLVAVGIVGIIAIISVQSLYDILGIRAKQQTIEESSENFRTMIRLVSKSIVEAQNLTVASSSELRITGGSSCQTFKFDPAAKSVMYANTLSTPCSPPNSGFTTISGSDLHISNLTFSPIETDATVVNLEVNGFYKSSLGDHPFEYKTTITPRI